jgi:two-component system, NarL family, nitrate/nitrite response regulator NarL
VIDSVGYNNPVIKLVIADTMDIVCKGLAQVLESSAMHIVGVCSTGFDLVKTAQREKPDVVLLDSEIRACTFEEAIPLIHRDLPDTKILMFGWPKEQRDLGHIIYHEASGYITRDITLENLVKAISLVADGELVLSPQMATNVLNAFDGLQKKVHVRVPLLTNREREVLAMVGKGQVNKDIATTLSISENTVKVHMRNVMKKVCLHTRGEAAAWLISHY